MLKKSMVALACATMIAGCTADPYTGEQRVSRTVLGAGSGAAAGALAGLLVGKTTNADTRKSVLIGAGIGALTGGGVGVYMDRQAAKLRSQLQGTGVSVTKRGDTIILNMPSNITFDSDQAAVKPGFYDTLNSVSLVLKEFDQTLVNVYGHTDSDGSQGYNQQLSQNRAVSVARYLSSQGVDRRRFYVVGYGEERPIASNATAGGKAENRRVEIEIEPLRGA